MSRSTASAKAGCASPPANAKDRFGNPMTVKLKGEVEPYFRKPAEG